MEQWHQRGSSHSPAHELLQRTNWKLLSEQNWGMDVLMGYSWSKKHFIMVYRTDREPTVCFFHWKRKDMVCSVQFQKLWTKTMRLKFFSAKHNLLQNELAMVVHFSFIDILGIIFCHLLYAFTIFMAQVKFYCLNDLKIIPLNH